MKVPVVIGASEGEREFIGTRQIAALVKSLSDEYQYPIFLNADHEHTVELAVEAAKAGCDSVIFDASAQDFDANVRSTKQPVETLRSINANIIVGVGILSTTEEAKQFVDVTGVDVLASAVGNMHGLLKSMIAGETRKRLNVDRIREIKEAVKIPLTLHDA